MFILNDTIKKADTTLKLMKIDTNDMNLHKPYDLIQVSTAGKLHVANYKRSTDFKGKVLFQDFIKKSAGCVFDEPFHGKISIKASHCSLLVLFQPSCSR